MPILYVAVQVFGAKSEAWTFVVLGYGTGSKAPGVPFTNLATHPYLAGHTVLLAHAEAVRREGRRLGDVFLEDQVFQVVVRLRQITTI